jgi:MoaA/NifB/PqqE/SkfB family radical SAM enzyme
MKNVFDSESKWSVRFRERAKRQLAPDSESFPRKASLRARLRNFARRIERALLRISQLRASRDDRRWTAHAFREFIGPEGKREAMLSSLAMQRRVLLRHLEEWRADDEKGRALAESLLNICTQIDDGSVWHKDFKLKSYVDVSIQVKALRIFVDDLSAVSGASVDSRGITALLLEHFPNSRTALLVHADILLEKGETDSAIDAIQRALRIQAVCPSAQQLLFRAFQLKRDAGSKDVALAVMDYDLKDKFCKVPFKQLSTGWDGNAHACSCPAWVPFPVGNILTAESADDIWNSDEAVEIRRSILDGDFSYCSRTLCSFITAQKLPRKDEITNPLFRRYIDNHTTTLTESPQELDLSYDRTCNLACPSCRTGIIGTPDHEPDIYSRSRDRVILPLLRKLDGALYISGGGEAFASKHSRSILSVLNRRDYPGLYLHLITNAQLLTPLRWKDFPDLPEMVGTLSVSIDAAEANTYEKLRRPGKWSTLMSNLELIAKMRRSGQIRDFWINFVVQKENYREMLDFVELGARLGVDQIWFQRVTNYGAYDEATFADIDVTSPQHPEHAELLEVLRSPLLRGPLINRQMLMSLLPEVVASDERLEFLY